MNSSSAILYKDGTLFQYASSLAATWVWAPALYVSSSIGYYYGLVGLLAFVIPNVLCMILFGLVASYSRKQVYHQQYSFLDAIEKAGTKQQAVHTIVGLILLVCSSIVQLLGMHLLLTQWFDLSKFYSGLIICAISVGIVWKGRLKGSIVTDSWKYIVTAVVGLILVGCGLFDGSTTIENIKIFDSKDTDYLIGFAIISGIGLLCAPYVDQTFWQRAYSVDRNNVVKTFLTGALLFVIVPVCFGVVGLLYGTNNPVPNWSIADQFTGVWGILLGAAIFCALLSTLDSNLCAVESLWVSCTGNYDEKLSRFSYLVLAGTALAVFSLIDITITQLFLIYGTIRTCIALPTIMIVFKRFDKTRLFYGTLAAIVFGAGGYLVMSYLDSPYAYICTIGALLIPLIGYKPVNT